MSKHKKFGSNTYPAQGDLALGDEDFGQPLTGGKYFQGPRCYESHPVVELGGGTFIGGSCSHPMVANADVYIGFDYGMQPMVTFPWDGDKTEQVYFPIKDMGVPANPESFIKLVNWTVQKLAEGKIVHAGCIGGHGRTGMFLAALIKTIDGDDDAITTTRKVYCKKAVESSAQIKFLGKYFGIKAVAESKSPVISGWSGKGKEWPKSSGGKELKAGSPFSGSTKVWTPVPAKVRIWGKII